MRFLPALVIPPRFFLGASEALEVAAARGVAEDFDLRAAHRAFIASEMRFRPAALIPPDFRPLPGPLLLSEFDAPVKPAPSSKELIALPIRSRSLFNSERICSRFNGCAPKCNGYEIAEKLGLYT
jgi:hypothetical protein